MRLNVNVLNWSLKVRAFIAGAVWFVVALIAFFCSQIGHCFVDWIQATAEEVSEKTNCRLNQVQLVWENDSHYTKKETILKSINIQQGDKMSDINLGLIQERLEMLPWVRSVVVERYWPNDLKITLKEKMPIALWQHNHRYHPLDERAEVIQTSTQLPADLLLVVGPDAPEHLISLLKDLEQVPYIYQYVRSAVRKSGRRWNLKLFDAENGLEINLPEQGVLQALVRLDEHNRKEKIIKRQLVGIDLRNPDKIILKPIPKPLKKPKALKNEKK